MSFLNSTVTLFGCFGAFRPSLQVFLLSVFLVCLRWVQGCEKLGQDRRLFNLCLLFLFPCRWQKCFDTLLPPVCASCCWDLFFPLPLPLLSVAALLLAAVELSVLAAPLLFLCLLVLRAERSDLVNFVASRFAPVNAICRITLCCSCFGIVHARIDFFAISTTACLTSFSKWSWGSLERMASRSLSFSFCSFSSARCFSTFWAAILLTMARYNCMACFLADLVRPVKARGKAQAQPLQSLDTSVFRGHCTSNELVEGCALLQVLVYSLVTSSSTVL